MYTHFKFVSIVRSTRCGDECLALFLGLTLLASTSSNAWEVSTHRSMGRYARTNLIHAANANSDLIPIAGANLLRDDRLWNFIEDFLENEDQGDNPLQHFYNPITGEGLFLGEPPFTPTIIFPSAVVRAEIFWRLAIDDYRADLIEDSLYALGTVCHLVEDMGCPAHTLNDPHPDFMCCNSIAPYITIPVTDFFRDLDSLHVYASDENHHVHSPDATMSGGSSIRQIMVDLATRSARWDSDDRCGYGLSPQGSGSLNHLGCPPGYWPNGSISNLDLATITAECMPLTE